MTTGFACHSHTETAADCSGTSDWNSEGYAMATAPHSHAGFGASLYEYEMSFEYTFESNSGSDSYAYAGSWNADESWGEEENFYAEVSW